MANFAQYGFNKSHSAAYALIAYRTAYLKAHYPVEFMAAALSTDMDNTVKIVTYINECREMGLKILPPDINESEREFNVIENSIRFGLEAVKGIGSSAIEAIIESRNQGKFTSFLDFCIRVDSRKVNKKVIENLIKSGALDSLGKRAQLMSAFSSVMDTALKAERERLSGQRSMFETHQTASQTLPEIEEWGESERLLMEKDALGFYITGHPLNRYKKKLEQLSVTPTHEIQDLPDKEDINVGGIPVKLKKIQTKRKGDLMAYLTIEDLHGTVELIVFPDIYRESVNVISQDSPIIISGQIDKSDKGVKIIAKKIVSIEDRKRFAEDSHPRRLAEVRKQKKEATKIGSNSLNPQSQDSKLPTGLIDKTLNSQLKVVTLTLNTNTDLRELSNLKDILLKNKGDYPVPVYLKIISPRHWETLILTGQHVTPTEKMILEIEGILGKGTAVLNSK
ncbi:MAG: hypothetical protein L0922_01150 [Candidatus Mariimomonas ferrooxydans]